MIEKEVLQNLLSNEFRVLRKRGRKVRIKWIDWLDHCFVRGVSVSMDTLGGIDPAPWLAWVAWRKSGRRIGSTIYLCLGYQDALRGDVDLLKDVLRHELMHIQTGRHDEQKLFKRQCKKYNVPLGAHYPEWKYYKS